MPNIGKEDKAARRRERRRLRREKNKSTFAYSGEKATIAADKFPMIFDWRDPTSYQEGYKSTATLSKSLTVLGTDKLEEEYLNITCYGKYTMDVQPNGAYREFVMDYFIPLAKLGQLGKKKAGLTSVDIINRHKEKKGTLYAHENGKLCFVVRKDDLIISGDTTKEYLAEHFHEGTQGGCNTIVKTAGKEHTGEHDHQWEKRTGVFAANQVDPTHLYYCSICGVRYKGGNLGVPPTKGCTGVKVAA